MYKKITWSPLSVNDFEIVLEYLHENWNEQVVMKYITEIESLLSNISKQPNLFPLVNKKLKVRKCVITKHNTLYYRIKENNIEIIRIFDTRQNPKKLKI
jgi:plasmid stabilization system protein ParE